MLNMAVIVTGNVFPDPESAKQITSFFNKFDHRLINAFNGGDLQDDFVYFTTQEPERVQGGGKMFNVDGAFQVFSAAECSQMIEDKELQKSRNSKHIDKIPAHTFLESGAKHMRDRAEQRDSEEGERSMASTVQAFNAIEGMHLTESQGWRFMCMLKLSRASQGVFVADDYEDLAAYGGLAGEAASEGK